MELLENALPGFSVGESRRPLAGRLRRFAGLHRNPFPDCDSVRLHFDLEREYGINLRALFTFADQHYEADPFFYPKAGEFNQQNAELLSKVHQALTIIFKLEGQIIARQPDFEMENRLFLQQAVTGAVEIDGRTYPLSHGCFQTVDPQHPYDDARKSKKLSKFRVFVSACPAN